jgi:chromosomal replication initiator protein
MDDLQRLEGKQAAQQELSQLVDSLVRRGCLVLATLRSHPLDTPELSYPLASRFSAGLVVPLALPDVAVRRALVEHFASEAEVDLPPAAMDKLASPGAARTSLTTAPQLRRAVIRLGELARQRGCLATRELTQAFLKEHEDGNTPTLKAIAAAVGRQFDVSVADLRSKSRLHSVTAARGVAMHLARELAGASYAEIGRYFGNRDHTTVIHACKKTAAAAAGPQVRQEIDQLRTQLTEDSEP